MTKTQLTDDEIATIKSLNGVKSARAVSKDFKIGYQRVNEIWKEIQESVPENTSDQTLECENKPLKQIIRKLRHDIIDLSAKCDDLTEEHKQLKQKQSSK